MPTRSFIGDLAAHEDGEVLIQGWIEKVRDQKKVQFVIIRDHTSSVQVVNVRHGEDDERANLISSLTVGSAVSVRGQLEHNERVKLGGIEIQLDELTLETLAASENPIADDTSIDKRLDWRFIDLRRPEANLIFRVQTTFEAALRKFWIDNDYTEIHTPKLMSSPSESRAELFSLDYFDTTAYLAQSPQFFKQMAMAAGFDRVFEIAPAFRADPSFTSRHATEFTSVDMEVSWVASHLDVADIHEQLMVAGLTAVAEKHGEEIKQLLGIDVVAPTKPFTRITLAKAHEVVAASGYINPRADGDLDPESERRVCAWAKETEDSDFVFVTDYDATIRPFYHMRHADDDTLTNSYDLLYRGVEISTGAQREHRIEKLEEQAKQKGLHPEELKGYLEFFRHGVPPHGGFGMGLARVLMLMLERDSIRETTYLFRGPNRLEP